MPRIRCGVARSTEICYTKHEKGTSWYFTIDLDPTTAKQIYLFTFNFAKIENQKNLSLETAIAFWDLLMAERFEYLDEWKKFLNEHHGKAISKDTWNLFWDFATNFSDFSSHDTDGIFAAYLGAWPLLIDSFVEHMREKS